MATIVLVHGAFGGSYGFRLVRPILSDSGHQVFTPSLTGIGERAHLATPEVSLTTHIRDVANAIFYEDLTDIVLLGFSYGGMVITGLLDELGDRVSHLVYLDAIVPADGQTAMDVLGPMAVGLHAAAKDGFVPAVPRELESPEATAWSEQRRVAQPLATLTEPVRLQRPLEDYDMTRTYIKVTGDPSESEDSGFWQAARHARSSPAWSYREIDTHHMAPMSRPEELSAILLEIAG